jgi:hypothetical protein
MTVSGSQKNFVFFGEKNISGLHAGKQFSADMRAKKKYVLLEEKLQISFQIRLSERKKINAKSIQKYVF